MPRWNKYALVPLLAGAALVALHLGGGGPGTGVLRTTLSSSSPSSSAPDSVPRGGPRAMKPLLTRTTTAGGPGGKTAAMPALLEVARRTTDGQVLGSGGAYTRDDLGDMTLLSSGTPDSNGTEITGLEGATAIAQHHDSSNVYVAGDANDGRVVAFYRATEEGIAAPLQFVGSYPAPNVVDVAVSDDGQNVYAVASATSTLYTFQRLGRYGALSEIQTIVDGETAGGDVVDSSLETGDTTDVVQGLGGAHAVAVAPDGLTVYVASTTAQAIAVFARDLVGGLQGALTFVQFFTTQHTPDGSEIPFVLTPRSILVSPESDTLFTSYHNGEYAAVIAWRLEQEDPSSHGILLGAPTAGEQISSLEIKGARDLELDATQNVLYVAGSHSISIIGIEPGPGAPKNMTLLHALAYETALVDAQGVPLGFSEQNPIESITVSSDGHFSYGAGGSTETMVHFRLVHGPDIVPTPAGKTWQSGSTALEVSGSTLGAFPPSDMLVAADWGALYATSRTDGFASFARNATRPNPTPFPTAHPSPLTTAEPTTVPTTLPTAVPVPDPTPKPTPKPTAVITPPPTGKPVTQPTSAPTIDATPHPTHAPVFPPTLHPTPEPTIFPVIPPSPAPTLPPTPKPTGTPSQAPSPIPTIPHPTPQPTFAPTQTPQYFISPRNAPDYCFTVPKADTNSGYRNGLIVTLAKCVNSKSQYWSLDHEKRRIHPRADDRFCVDTDFDRQIRRPITLFRCDRTFSPHAKPNHQEWAWDFPAAGQVRSVGHKGLCMSAGKEVYQGRYVQQTKCDSDLDDGGVVSDPQLFDFRPVSESAAYWTDIFADAKAAAAETGAVGRLFNSKQQDMSFPQDEPRRNSNGGGGKAGRGGGGNRALGMAGAEDPWASDKAASKATANRRGGWPAPR